MISFYVHIPGEPVAKGRPRAQIRAGKDGVAYPHMHTPAATAAAEREIWAEFKNAYPGAEAIDEPFALTLAFHEGVRSPQRQQDLDNMVKLVMDALNRHAWTDDRLCVCLTATVVRDAQSPHTEIMVRTLSPSEVSTNRRQLPIEAASV